MIRFLPFILLAGVTFAQAQTNRYDVLFVAVDDLSVNPDNNTVVAAQMPEIVNRLKNAIPE